MSKITPKSQWLMLAAFLLTILVPHGVRYLYNINNHTPDKAVLTIWVQLVAILMPAIVFLYFNRDFYSAGKFINLNPAGVRMTALCCVWGVLLQFVTIVLNVPGNMLAAQFFKSLTTSPPPADATGYMWMIISVVLLPALCEEFLFRGVMLSAQINRGNAKAILVVAMFFTLFHQNAANFLGIFLLGVSLSYVTAASSTLMAPILLHLFYNGTGTALQYAVSLSDLAYGIIAVAALPLIIWIARSIKLPQDGGAAEADNSSKASVDEKLGPVFGVPTVLIILGYAAIQYFNVC